MDPAYAGMILLSVKHSPCNFGGPRVCGDDPTLFLAFILNVVWTPRMRG